MATPDSGLGITAGFDATTFRNAITFAMQMGAPVPLERRAKFIFKASGEPTYLKDGDEVTPAPRLDRDGVPLDPEIEVVEALPTEVVADCAIEIEPADPEELPVGRFRATKAVVTILDNAYTSVQGCNELLYNGDRYGFGYETHGLGLFDVGVYVLTFYAIEDN